MKRLWLLLVVIFLVGCGSQVRPGDTSKIALGMSEDEVVELLGKPDIQTTDRKELETTYNNYASLYATDIEFQKDLTYEESMGGWTEVSPFFNAVEGKQNVKVYDYALDNNYHINIFFLDNEVIVFYELDLGVTDSSE